ncbi:MAG: helix-turn-helix domain-containing protein [Deltaproteobacteria bacterium]|nr:helix-turn-helix domain-containing protein [Deltaproteobacteria bacterium]
MVQHDCRSCERFHECATLCEPVAAIVAEVEHHGRGAMIPASPHTVAILAATDGRIPWSEMIGDEITVEEIESMPGLTARQRRALSLMLIETLSSREIARSMGISQSTALGHLRAALRKTRRRIDRLRAAQRGVDSHIGRSV